MRSGSVIEIKPPTEFDRQTVREFFYAKPLIERGKSVFDEMLWVLQGRESEGQHLKILPGYCYNIFGALTITFFKNFPAFTDIIFIKDRAGLAEASTIEAAKKVIQIDWKNLGCGVGIGLRCARFAEMEAADGLDGEGFDQFSPEEVKQAFVIVFGQQWVEDNAARIASESPDKILSVMLKQFIAPWIEKMAPAAAMCSVFACQWSPAAFMEFHEGLSAGLGGFLDANSQLIGETSRSGTYVFLLLAWPEIKAMMEDRPKKTLSDLHAWMLPFMRMGVTPYLDIDQFRDVCAPPSQKGIGLSLRPLKSSRASA
jgi:hypothetical protein